MMRVTIAFFLSLSMIYSVAAQAGLQHPPGQNAQSGSTDSPKVVPQSRDYLLGPGDVVTLKVVELEQLSKTVRISNSGKIHLPFLGVFPVAGMTSMELETDIASRLKRQKLVKDPQVQVMIADYRAQPVYILGEVGRPGQYVLNRRTYLMDLITMAGGVNDVARNYGYLFRRTHNKPAANQWNPTSGAEPGLNEPKDPLYQVTKVDLTSLIKGEKLELNLELQGGDLFHIPLEEEEIYYVVGDVLRTGAFALPMNEDLLVSRALSTAGGPARTAKMSKGMVVRHDAAGQRQEIPTDFAAIFKGKKPDFPIQAGDIIFIPGSHIKTIGYGLLGILPSLAGRAVYQDSTGYLPRPGN